ncbi:MAG: hypothetical protein GXO86_02735 [Chlorobi bacterium]|nr:hypothetical protein [Chlorobiota bacterium]
MAEKNIFTTRSLFQVLSLDITIGALAVGWFAVKLFGVVANPVWWIVLPLSVWSVYTADHLADGLKQKENSAIYRHDFHYRYRKILIPVVALTGTGAIVLACLFLDPAILEWGIILSGLILLYLLIVVMSGKNGSPYFHKELFIAFAYTAGIFLAPFVWYNGVPDYPVGLAVFYILLLAWCETVIVSFFDYNRDKADGNTSFAVRYGKNKTRMILMAVMVIMAGWLIFSVFLIMDKMSTIPLVIEFLMLTILFFIIFKHSYFQKNNLYRWLGEAVFWLPALLAFFY